MRHARRDDADLIGTEAEGLLVDHDVHLAGEHEHRLLFQIVVMDRRLARMHQPDLVDAALEPRHGAPEVALQDLDLRLLAPFGDIRHDPDLPPAKLAVRSLV